jgi:competence protein ComEC
VKKAIWLFGVLLFLTGFQQGKDVPTKIEKIDLKLMGEEVAFTFLNLTDGEVTILQNKLGEAILFNTGNGRSKEQLSKYLDLYGVTSINKIILTRLGADYDGNLKWLLKQYRVKNVVVPSSVTKEDLAIATEVEAWTEGENKDLFQGVTASVLQVMDNEKSMNISLKYGEHRFLFMSIASKVVEDQLIKKHKLKDVNILKVAEFANNNGTSQELLEAVDPQVAIIFNKKNVYPSADVLERLQNTWIDIYYTKQFGNITIKCNKEQYEVITITVESLKGMNS